MTDLPDPTADRAANDASPEAADATEPVFDVTSAAAGSTSPDPDEPAVVACRRSRIAERWGLLG